MPTCPLCFALQPLSLTLTRLLHARSYAPTLSAVCPPTFTMMPSGFSFWMISSTTSGRIGRKYTCVVGHVAAVVVIIGMGCVTHNRLLWSLKLERDKRYISTILSRCRQGSNGMRPPASHTHPSSPSALLLLLKSIGGPVFPHFPPTQARCPSIYQACTP